MPNRIITSGSGVNSGTDQPPTEQLSDANQLAQQSLVNGLNVYPNPFTDELNVEFFNTAAGNKIMVDLYDVSGRLVYRKNVGTMGVGRNRVTLNLGENAFNPGVYIAKLNVNGETLSTAKVVKSRK